MLLLLAWTLMIFLLDNCYSFPMPPSPPHPLSLCLSHCLQSDIFNDINLNLLPHCLKALTRFRCLQGIPARARQASASCLLGPSQLFLAIPTGMKISN